MVKKKTGISRDLIIHPGETIADVLAERHITQADLAIRTGVSPAYVSAVISGKNNISAKFAQSLEYALGVPASFWLNLQANYDAELMAYNELLTITEEERNVYVALREVVNFLRSRSYISNCSTDDEYILSARKFLKISNLVNLKKVIPQGSFRLDRSVTVNPYVMGAWIRLCQISGEGKTVSCCFNPEKKQNLIEGLKAIMCDQSANIQISLQNLMEKHGIVFSVTKNFRGAPVQGYIDKREDGTYQIVQTIRRSYADIFWFSLFHEIGHLVNGDVERYSRFIDDGSNDEKEYLADQFARDNLLDPLSYQSFISHNKFDIASISDYAKTQNVMPYIVIGRLQKEKLIEYSQYSSYKLRYKWAE